MHQPRFPLGALFATRGVIDLLAGPTAAGAHDAATDPPVERVAAIVARHESGDWGELDAEDRAVNDHAVHHGGRLLSAHRINGHRVWIITEADRTTTTVLLPGEY